MYAACLFCNRPLGRNETLEHFPVGRRLAYDPAKGRLWVVCQFCERWNLTPLEERWEAIEEAERAFRASVLRVATDNVGLAQLREGLDLVRIGAPPRSELAAWRYGDQFSTRRRRRIALGVAGVVAGGPLALATMPLGGAIAFIGITSGLTYNAVALTTRWRDTHLATLFVRDDAGSLLALTHRDARCAALIPTDDGRWYLKLPHSNLHPASALLARLGIRNTASAAPDEATLSSAAAQRALAAMLPHLNRTGGGERHVRAAVDVIGATANVDVLLRAASINTEAKQTHFKIKDGESNVGALPARLRLALEMVLHEDDERRAMEGELHELEARWRDAEAIAGIADSLIAPADIDARIEAFRNRGGDTTGT